MGVRGASCSAESRLAVDKVRFSELDFDLLAERFAGVGAGLSSTTAVEDLRPDGVRDDGTAESDFGADDGLGRG